jgi:hypothetical protein
MTAPYTCWALPGRRDRFNYTLIDLRDVGWLRRHRYFVTAKGYVVRRDERLHWKFHELHRDILHARPGQIVHHDDHCPMNNRRENLKIKSDREHREIHAKSWGD